jgi:hypothetical protein
MKFFGIDINLHLRDNISFFLTNNWLSKKIFGLNRSIIFNRAVTRRLITYFGADDGQNINLSSGNLGYGFIHYGLILNIKPKRILCIGSRKGFIPAICALACQENNFGHVDFVDAGYDETHPKHWTGIGFWKKNDPIKHFSFLEINNWITTYVMTTEEFAKKYNYRYQYIYIDGDHSYEGVTTDYNLFWPRLDKMGLMVFHDVIVKRAPNLPPFGVWKFFKEIKANKIIFPFPKVSGLGIVQKC